MFATSTVHWKRGSNRSEVEVAGENYGDAWSTYIEGGGVQARIQPYTDERTGFEGRAVYIWADDTATQPGSPIIVFVDPETNEVGVRHAEPTERHDNRSIATRVLKGGDES